MSKIEVKRISMEDPLYQGEQELRNQVLLRPIGLADYSYEQVDLRAWHFVALKDQDVVGCVMLLPDEKHKQSAHLRQMAVAESVQGQGVGMLLVGLLVNFAKEQGIEEIRCPARETAVRFYEKLGFELYGEPYLSCGLPHRSMLKKL